MKYRPPTVVITLFSVACPRPAWPASMCDALRRLGVLSILLFSNGSGRAEKLPRDAINFFENRIRPVLVERCYECHSAGAKKLKGGLRLDSREGIMRGGDSGPVLVPGKADESLLIEAIRYQSVEMPPSGKLPPSIVADLVMWINMGAPDPRVGDAPALASQGTAQGGEEHWAFQPVRDPHPPDVAQRDWPLSDVDRFVLKRLELNGLSPVNDAARFTWLRRVSIDLTGLPPTLTEIDQFAADTSPAAYTVVVDRLLASRAFGQRWARHWLDLVGYADQIGTSNSVFAEHAWRYRDYVIDAFNRDMPFDRFIREQIAGDLLEYDSVEDRAAGIVATGFLVLGDLEIVEADKAKMRVDIVDQQVVKTSKAFLGLTVGCARCHDHKFDPVSQHDYYAMAGFFFNTQSVYKTERGVWSDVISRQLPETRAQQTTRQRESELYAARLASWKAERDQLLEQQEQLDAQLKQAESGEKQRLSQARETKDGRLRELNRWIVHGEFFMPRPPRTYGVRDLPECANMRITIRGNPHALGDEVPRGYVEVIARGFPRPTLSTSASGRRHLADWIASPQNPLTSRVIVNRVWQKLFGNGLVTSVDYFGVRGERPSHPDLLDYIATRFVTGGWSQKELIRSLVLSRTYQLSSRHQEKSHRIDAANRLLWRMNRRRLDAESIRDSMLASSGQLHASAGGPALPLEYVENVGNVDPANVNPPSFSLSRYRPEQPFLRTVYLPVVRSSGQRGPAELRNMFDFPQPAQFTGKRATTAVPTQALFLMNSPQIKEHARRLAVRISHEVVAPDERLSRLWLLVVNRLPTDHERAAAQPFLADEASFVELCHALFLTNEFLMTL